MKKIILLFFIFLLLSYNSTFSQLIVEEFNYPAGNSLTSHGYYPFIGGSSNPIKIIEGSLSYSGYPSSGIGNMIQINNPGQSVHDSISSTVISSGTLYAAMLVNVDSARLFGDFFFLFAPSPIDSLWRARILVKLAENGNISFGINKATTYSKIAFSDSIYNTGTTYLLAAAYKFVNGPDNDSVKLWINPDLSGIEPPADLIVADSNLNNSDISIGTFAFRQGYDTIAPFLKVDGLRIDTTWFDTVVPVELLSFFASVQNRSVQLNWSTATETNNKGFEVQRKAEESDFIQVGFIGGQGTTAEAQSYSFIDKELAVGNYTYRLKQIDFDGKFEYSNLVEAEIIAPSVFELKQNYPNPFNPATSINFSLAVDSKVSLKIYNVIGQEIAEVLNSQIAAGSHTINFDASSFGELNSGVYFYRINAYGIDGTNFSSVKKMILTK